MDKINEICAFETRDFQPYIAHAIPPAMLTAMIQCYCADFKVCVDLIPPLLVDNIRMALSSFGARHRSYVLYHAFLYTDIL